MEDFKVMNKGGFRISLRERTPGKFIIDNREIPSRTYIFNRMVLGIGCKIGRRCKIGDDCTFGNCCSFGDGCEFGDGCKIGDSCEFGENCKIGKHCTIGGVAVQEGQKATSGWCRVNGYLVFKD